MPLLLSSEGVPRKPRFALLKSSGPRYGVEFYSQIVGWHAQAEGAGMSRLAQHMAALRLAMLPNDRSREQASRLPGNVARPEVIAMPAGRGYKYRLCQPG